MFAVVTDAADDSRHMDHEINALHDLFAFILSAKIVLPRAWHQNVFPRNTACEKFLHDTAPQKSGATRDQYLFIVKRKHV